MVGGDIKPRTVGGIGLKQRVQRKQRVAEVQVRFRQPRLELDRAPAVLDRGAEVAEAMQSKSKVSVQPRISRRTRECVAKAAYAQLVAAKSGEQGPVLVQQLRAGVVREQPLEI